MVEKFQHTADKLQEDKKVIFAAQSAHNFHQRMLICKYVFEQGAVPVNPFNTFGYYLYELVERDIVRNGNNNLLKRCDELWVFGDISDGILSEIKSFKKLQRPIRYFDISGLPKEIKEVKKISDLPFESNVEKFRQDFLKD
ncbi:MAG: hypothetical protein Q8P54_01495 [bacterium]|nr:hypothetical protein [bacterium]